MFVKSDNDRHKSHKFFYVNIINWKTENCQIGMNAQAPERGGGYVPQCRIAADANALKQVFKHTELQ